LKLKVDKNLMKMTANQKLLPKVLILPKGQRLMQKPRPLAEELSICGLVAEVGNVLVGYRDQVCKHCHSGYLLD
jgi:hypothetical protein